jgi:hypothetical protein
MREIKFRGWDGETMYAPQDLSQAGNAWSWLGRFDVELMQYTGIMHKKRELWEGDVYYIAGTGNCRVKICPMYGVVFRGTDGYDSPYIDELAESNVEDFLGNIYENPELMEKEK